MGSRGKWNEEGVPHKGWTCVGVVDLEEPSQTCEMCESAQIRYAHHMEHPGYAQMLTVGCECAANMEEDYAAAGRREASMRRNAAKKSRWTGRRWRPSRDGNWWLRTQDGFRVVIYRDKQRPEFWCGLVIDTIFYDRKLSSKQLHATLDAAKLAAFDTMIALEASRFPALPTGG
ncbi:MAG: hypothetical protein IAG13_12880 [Deltaproteobacteria bacterium]|nr:hypothetical protein [Nannocystaceae bacterium]